MVASVRNYGGDERPHYDEDPQQESADRMKGYLCVGIILGIIVLLVAVGPVREIVFMTLIDIAKTIKVNTHR